MCSSAPTGSGKTAIGNLALVRFLAHRYSPTAKVVYLSPTKALSQEKYEAWYEDGFVKLCHRVNLTTVPLGTEPWHHLVTRWCCGQETPSLTRTRSWIFKQLQSCEFLMLLVLLLKAILTLVAA